MNKTTAKPDSKDGASSETEYLLRSPANARHLKRSIEQHRQGMTKQDAQAKNPSTVKLGSLLAQIGREVGLTDADCEVFDRVRAQDLGSAQEVDSTVGDVVGMAWWNSLSEVDRRYWCLAAMTAVPADAWKYFRLVTAPRRSVKVSAGE